MTIAIQRWLGVRLDILGNMLILGICLFAAGFRDTVDPSKIGVVLTYTLSSECLVCHREIHPAEYTRHSSYSIVL